MPTSTNKDDPKKANEPVKVKRTQLDIELVPSTETSSSALTVSSELTSENASATQQQDSLISSQSSEENLFSDENARDRSFIPPNSFTRITTNLRTRFRTFSYQLRDTVLPSLGGYLRHRNNSLESAPESQSPQPQSSIHQPSQEQPPQHRPPQSDIHPVIQSELSSAKGGAPPKKTSLLKSWLAKKHGGIESSLHRKSTPTETAGTSQPPPPPQQRQGKSKMRVQSDSRSTTESESSTDGKPMSSLQKLFNTKIGSDSSTRYRTLESTETSDPLPKVRPHSVDFDALQPRRKITDNINRPRSMISPSSTESPQGDISRRSSLRSLMTSWLPSRKTDTASTSKISPVPKPGPTEKKDGDV